MADHRRGGMAVAAALLCAPAAQAGPLLITPTTVTIAPDRHSAVVEVRNTGDTAVDLQFRAYDWGQDGGEDRLTPTDALVVSPAIATVAPYGRQVFRILQLGDRGSAPTHERSYRLRLNQLPRADQRDVAILLEFSLPVFQTPAGAEPRLAWTLTPDGVTVTNSGGRRTRISALALAGAGGQTAPIAGASAAYLLSGATRTFRIAQQPREAVRLVGIGDAGAIDVPRTALAAR